LNNLNFSLKDYAIACASLSIIASSLAIIFLWVSGLVMCIENRFAKLRVSELLIAGTLLIGNLNTHSIILALGGNINCHF
jgi:hypothetical protein